MKIDRLNDDAVWDVLNAIFNRALIECDDEWKREFLKEIVENVMEPLAQDDFFGTEGWEHWAGLDA